MLAMNLTLALAQDDAPQPADTVKPAATDKEVDPLDQLLDEIDSGESDLETAIEDANARLREDREMSDYLDPKKILEMLGNISEKMTDSGELILKAQEYDPSKSQEEIMKEIQKLLDEATNAQKSAVDGAGKILDYSEQNQGSAIKKLEKLIEVASQMAQQQQQQQSEKESEEQKKERMRKMQKQQQDKSENPATKPYNTANKPPEMGSDRKFSESSDKWGALPPKLRDEMLQIGDLEIIPEHKSKIEEYYKVLGSEEE